MEVNNQQKFNGLDHLRTLAILFVFLFHYYILSGGLPLWLPTIASFGWTGVDLFFVLSGYLISSQLFEQIKHKKNISFKYFFLKRFFRIVPAYLATVGIYFLFPFFREKESLPPLWKFLTFSQNFGLDIKNFGTFSHAWSLCVEEHFYFLLPLILIFLQRKKLIKKSVYLLFFLFGIGFISRIYSFNYLYAPHITDENSWLYWYKYIYYPTYNRLDGLLIGISIAGIYHFLPNVWQKIAKYNKIFIFIFAFLLIYAYILCEEPMTFEASIFGFPLIAITYGCLLIGAISPTNFLYQWNSNVSTLIANLSYAIYLTHKGVIHMTHQLLGNFNINSNLLLLLSIINCLSFAFLLNLLIEKPLMVLRKKIIDSK